MTAHTNDERALLTKPKRKTGITIKHGMRYTPEYMVWIGMRARCNSSFPKSKKYYAEHGVSVCDRWMNSFENFISDMGKRPTPKHSVERIDNSLGYSPGNCRWATSKDQARNRRSNRLLEIDGVVHCVAEWSEISGVNSRTITDRLNKNWSAKDAVFTKPR